MYCGKLTQLGFDVLWKINTTRLCCTSVLCLRHYTRKENERERERERERESRPNKRKRKQLQVYSTVAPSKQSSVP